MKDIQYNEIEQYDVTGPQGKDVLSDLYQQRALRKRNSQSQIGLLRLSDCLLTLSDPVIDLRERKVLDCNGKEIGSINDLFIEIKAREVRFMEVASKGVARHGETHLLLPLEAIIGLRQDAVLIQQTRERIAEAPAYDPERIPNCYYEDIYRFYGYAPHWHTGYVFMTSSSG